ncbi:MAG TPA: C-GCAxxG-C-C family protein [Spirochaetota bacterium]|nr:C-GCAxxG-C-C family protein [Spirochaetota bacterium]
MTRQEYIEKALSLFNEGYACAQSVLLSFAPDYGINEIHAKLIASTFGGGMGRLREKCGAVTGAFMVIGHAYGNTDPKDMDTKLNAYGKVREINRIIQEIYGTTQCGEILRKHVREADVKDRKHHRIICVKVIAHTVGALYDILSASDVVEE